MSDHVLVCGLGRCGMTMMMQMLEAGGHPVHGRAPDYEPDTLFTQGRGAADGTAIKFLNPHMMINPIAHARAVLWLDRAPKQQALSQLRLLGVPENRQTVRKLVASLKKERGQSLDCLPTDKIHFMEFETILMLPMAMSALISRWIEYPLDVEAMARCVHARGPESLKSPIERRFDRIMGRMP